MPVVIPGSTADYLSLVDGSGGVALHRTPRKRQTVALPTTRLLRFDSLAYPRVYFGESRSDVWDVEYGVTMDDTGALAALYALLYASVVLLWRDVHGNVTYVAVSSISRAPTLPLPPSITHDVVSFSIARVTYP